MVKKKYIGIRIKGKYAKKLIGIEKLINKKYVDKL